MGRYAGFLLGPTYVMLIFKSLYRLYNIHDINGWVDGWMGGWVGRSTLLKDPTTLGSY